MSISAQKIVRKRRQPENGLQIIVARFLSHALPEDAVAHHSPNEGARSAREGSLLKKRGMRPGWPDVQIFYGGKPYLIELKDESKGLSKSQKELHPQLERAGAKIAVCRSLAEVQAALDLWDIPLSARVFGFQKQRAA